MKRLVGFGFLALGIFLVPGCGFGGFDAGSLGGDFGATQGGVQDMAFARELIDNGQVPPPEAFTVEGMFSEHDLPLSGTACSTLLCLRGALGVAPTLDQEPSGWVQIGMSSTIDLENFHRPSLTLIATVDVSGSMGWDYSSEEMEYPTPGCLTRKLLEEIASRLGPDDRIAIVTYGSNVRTTLELTSGDDQEAIQDAIADLSANGSTNMEGGLRRAYDLAFEAGRQTDQVRVMLFTDVQPNVGATSATQFEQMAAEGAAEDVGLTVMGVGLGLGAEVLNALVHLKGGNAFSLFKNDDIEELLRDDWPWLVSPIAYDLNVSLTPSEGFQVAETYGFPGGTEEESDASMNVATVFLSKRKGALLVRLSPIEGSDLSGLGAHAGLSYLTPAGDEVSDSFDLAFGDRALNEQGQFFEQASVQKTVALAILVSNMKRAAEEYSESHQDAVAIMQQAVERIEADAQAIEDETIDAEVDLARDLLALMEQGASQGDLYGQRY